MTRGLIYIVDSARSSRQRLMLLLWRNGFCVESFVSAEDFLQRADLGAEAGIITALQLEGMSGLELQKRVSGHQLNMPLAFVANEPDIRPAVAAMKAGALDFLQSPLADFHLIDLASRLAEAASRNACSRRRGPVRLARRQLTMRALLREGLTNMDIAERMQVSVKTVQRHRVKLQDELGATSRANLLKTSV